MAYFVHITKGVNSKNQEYTTHFIVDENNNILEKGKGLSLSILTPYWLKRDFELLKIAPDECTFVAGEPQDLSSEDYNLLWKSNLERIAVTESDLSHLRNQMNIPLYNLHEICYRKLSGRKFKWC